MERTIQYELSDMDKMGMSKTVELFMIYEHQPTIDQDKLMSSIIEGTKHATSLLPFMAGDLQIQESGKVHIVTTPGSQVDVKVRRFESKQHKSIRALAANHFHPKELDPINLLPKKPEGKNPVCTMQLSFIEGGLILACRVNHAAGDWTSIDTFLSLLCQSTKAYTEGLEIPTYTPDINRAPFNASASESTISKTELQEKLPMFKIMNLSSFKPKPPPASKSGIYKASQPSIQQLKVDCTPFLNGVDYITSYDCISALVWTAVTRARLHLHPENSTSSSRFIHPIDLRARDPDNKTSERYFGNAVIATKAGPLTAETLVSDGISGIALAASSIRQSIRSVDMSSISYMTSLMKSLSPGEMIGSRADFSGMDLLMNSWYTGTAAKYDVGAAATPVAVRLPPPMVGAAMILPNFSRSGTREFEVLLELAVEEQELLRKDVMFLKYFEIVA